MTRWQDRKVVKLDELDDDFYFYIDQAIKYGSYAYEVNLELSKLQLLYWGGLPKLSTKVGLEQIKRTLLNYARTIERPSLVLSDLSPINENQCK